MRLLQTITPQTLGLSMSVYRCALTGGCTKGASVRYNDIWIASDHLVTCQRGSRPLFRGEGYITYEEALQRGMPCFQIGVAGDRRHALPVLKEGQKDVWFMFGGNFAYTSDSRGSAFPIHIHDRTEDENRACYPFFGAGDMPVETDGYSSAGKFVQWLDDTLIPDLVESGMEATADSFRTATKFIRNKLP